MIVVRECGSSLEGVKVFRQVCQSIQMCDSHRGLKLATKMMSYY